VSLFAAACLLLVDASSFAVTRTFTATGDVGSWAWTPTRRRIHRGDRIRWTNPTSVSHKVVAYGGNWSYDRTVPSGETIRKRFRRRGRFRFRCTIPGHSELSADGVCSGMCGRVVVRR